MGYRQSTSTDQDAINAAALDVDIPTPNLDDAIEDAKKLTSSAESQQTKDTKFLNSSDVFTALGTGIMALMTGGASLGASLGVGAGAAVDSSINRRKASAAQAEQNADQFRSEALQLHGASTNQYVAKMNMMGRLFGSDVPMTGATGERLLEILKYGTPEEYAQGQASLVADGFTAAAYITQDMLLKSDQNKFVRKNYSTLARQSTDLARQGYVEQARAVLQGHYNSAIPDHQSLLDPDDEMFPYVMDYVINNTALSEGQRDYLRDGLQALKVADPAAYAQMAPFLQSISTPFDLVQEELYAKLSFLADSYQDDDPALAMAIRMFSMAGPIADNFTSSILDPGGIHGGSSELAQKSLQFMLQHLGKSQPGEQRMPARPTKRLTEQGGSPQPVGTPSDSSGTKPTGDVVNDPNAQKSFVGNQALDQTLATFDQFQLAQFTSLQSSIDQIVKDNPIFASASPQLAMTAIFDQLHRDNAGLARIMEAQEFRAALEMYVRNLLSGTKGSAANGSE